MDKGTGSSETAPARFADSQTRGSAKTHATVERISAIILLWSGLSTARLIIMCGLPGAGKTTRAKQLESRFRAVHLCPDDWLDALSIDLYDDEKRAKIEALQWKLCQQLLSLGLTVIIDWGTWGRSERDELRVGARALGAAVELRYIEAPPDVLLARIQRRGRKNPPITSEGLSQWQKVFQAPTPEEMALFDEPLAEN